MSVNNKPLGLLKICDHDIYSAVSHLSQAYFGFINTNMSQVSNTMHKQCLFASTVKAL